MSKLFGVQIAMIAWPIRIVMGIAGLLLMALGMAVLAPDLFGWTVPHHSLLVTANSWICGAFLFWFIFGEKIKSHTNPKASEVWADSLRAMREHKLITACLAFALFGSALKLVVDVVFRGL